MLLVTALITKLSIDMNNRGYDPLSAVLVGLTHDLGKSRMPKELLGKDTPLTKSELDILKAHTLVGYLLLCYYLGASANEVLDAARDHHEVMDMTGYPRGVGKIGKYTRLITPIDIFDALISERPYRGSSFTIRQGLDYLIEQANTGRLDKEVVYYLISYVRKEHPAPGELLPYEKGTKLSRSDTAYGKIIPDA
jgi:HD-GYP domain-containing protein (c-di-GMP phosphodiesterase class II)